MTNCLPACDCGTCVDYKERIDELEQRLETNAVHALVLASEHDTEVAALEEQLQVEPTERMAAMGYEALEFRGFKLGSSDLGHDDLIAVFKAMQAAREQS